MQDLQSLLFYLSSEELYRFAMGKFMHDAHYSTNVYSLDFSILQLMMLTKQLTTTVNTWSPLLNCSQESDAAYRSLQHFSDMCRKGRSSIGVRTGE